MEEYYPKDMNKYITRLSICPWWDRITVTNGT